MMRKLNYKPHNVIIEVFSILKNLFFHFKLSLIILFMLALITLINYNKNLSYITKNVVETITLPLYSSLNFLRDSTTGITNNVSNYWHTTKQLKELQTKYARLTNLQWEIERLELENEQLKKILNYVKDYNKRTTLVRVLRKNTLQEGGTLVINAGKNNNVAVGDILTYNGVLVGIVEEVYQFSAKVITIFNKKFSVPAYTANSQRSLILQGNNYGKMKIKFQEINEQKLINGELVIASGEGKLVPNGTIVGNVEHLANGEVIIKPKIDYHLLDFVRLLRQNG